jgi:hypothetical protein
VARRIVYSVDGTIPANPTSGIEALPLSKLSASAPPKLPILVGIGIEIRQVRHFQQTNLAIVTCHLKS